MISVLYPEKDILKEDLSDQKVSIRVKIINPPMDGAYGLLVRAKENKNLIDYYAFLMDSYGSFAYMVYKNDQWTPLIDWQESPDFDMNGWNKLSVEAAGSHFRLFVNDNLAGEVDDDTLAGGTNGLFIETFNSDVSFQLQFDDFEVSLPTP